MNLFIPSWGSPGIVLYSENIVLNKTDRKLCSCGDSILACRGEVQKCQSYGMMHIGKCYQISRKGMNGHHV